MTNLFLALAAILAPGDATMRDALKAAIEQPAKYLQAHEATAQRLRESKNAATDPKFPWLVLVDELLSRHRAVELDWKSDRAEILAQLERLDSYKSLAQKVSASFDDTTCDDGMTVTCLRAISARIGADKFVLAGLDIDSDSYVVVVLSQADYTRAAGNASQLGFILKDIREHDPNQF